MQCQHTFTREKLYSLNLVVEDAAGRRRFLTAEVPVGRAMRHDVTVDDSEAARFGRWDYYLPDTFTGPGAQRTSMRHGKPSAARARFQPYLPSSGRYLLCIGFRPAKDQATAARIIVHHAAGVKRATINQRDKLSPLPFTSLGEFRFRAGDEGYVDISNADANGRVAIDAVRWVWIGE
jgi:hypothetical protein